MSRGKKGSRRDPIEQAMELALRLGDFIGYDASWEFVSGLEEVERDIAELLSAEPERAVDLYETFVAGCYEKAEEIDDSSGSFGMFVEDLFRGWIGARQAAGSDAEETARMLLGWMDNDDYGFCYQLEREAAKVLTKKGLSALASQVRARYDAADPAKARGDGGSSGYRRRYWGQALKTLYAAQRNVDAYVSLCEETELVPPDCEILAGIIQSRRKPDQALAWVERGLELQKHMPGGQGASYKLADMKRALLTKLGRGSEAFASAWSEFEKYPSRLAYDQLMKYAPKAERAAWHDKAMDASAQADLNSIIDLWLSTMETERLVERLRAASNEGLESLSHYITEPAGKKLSRSHPDIAAKVYRALGMRILNAKKSRYYDAALSSFEKAKRCYRKAGLDPEWDELAGEIRRNHGRKSSFMPGFERLVQGKKPDATPSFRDRAQRRKTSWTRRGRSENNVDDGDA
jgi:hypothetical protein